MSTITLIIVIVLLTNAVSFTFYITDCDKYMTVSGNINDTTKPKAYLICGLGAKTADSFKFIEFPGYEKVYLDYSRKGFSPILAGIQLSALVNPRDIVCGVSLGAKVARYSLVDLTRAILINPCLSSELLNSNLKRLIRFGWPILSSLELLIGWLSLLPWIPTNKGVWQSPASVVDQLYWIGHDPEVLRYYEHCRAPELRTNFILSDDDEFIDCSRLGMFPSAYFVEIFSKHARLGEPTEAPKYQSAINHFLKTIPS